MGTKVGNIVAKFVIKVLPKIIVELGYGTRNVMVQTLYMNTTTLPIALRRVHHRHIGTILRPKMYLKLSQTKYVDPDDPGDIPIISVGKKESEQ